ncbi:MAG: ribosome small subunit-dependent GTPase A [Pseudomonadales bacterium]
MPIDMQALQALGWKQQFAAQLTLEELESAHVVRVMAVQRGGLSIAPDFSGELLPLGGRWFQLDAVERPTVGDWLVLSADGQQIERVLERSSLLKRVVPGRTSEVQLIGANVDTMLVVTSCNLDFNPSRIERYLALAYDAGATPVLVLTKADLVEETESYIEQARQLGDDLAVEVVNALDASTLAGLQQWCGAGATVALLGSSGVGKSTLLNSLAGSALQITGAIREDDAKGRHTTTHRSLHELPSGALLLDSPGIRELQITDMDSGLEAAFADVEQLAEGCRFNDCQHRAEPGCAVQAAIDSGDLDARRLASYEKLGREERYARESVAERHARVRSFGKMVRNATHNKPKK